MWQVLKAVTIIFTICPGLQQKKRNSPCNLYKKKKNSIFFSLLFSGGEKNPTFLFLLVNDKDKKIV